MNDIVQSMYKKNKAFRVNFEHAEFKCHKCKKFFTLNSLIYKLLFSNEYGHVTCPKKTIVLEAVA